MFLKALRLENIRCFEDLTLNFEHIAGSNSQQSKNRKWTIVLGENGTGKSTILRAAALITCGSPALADVLRDPKEWVRRGKRSCRISATIQTKHGDDRELRLEMTSTDSISEVISRATKGLSLLDEALGHSERSYFVAGYGSSRRLSKDRTMHQSSSRYRSPRAQSIATLFDTEATLNPLESWAMQLDYEEGAEGLQIVQKAISSFLKGLVFDRIDKKAKQLLFKTPDGSIPLSQLSDGYQNVAAWVGDLLFRIHQVFDDYKVPLKTRGLLIIDEVDLHLHPRWQRSLHTFLQQRLPNMQLLVTTHSAVTAQQAQENELHFLKREGKFVHLYRFDASPSNLLINQLLLSEAFGLDTDESKELETKKNKYRKLRDAVKLTDTQRQQLTQLKSEIGEQLDQRARTVRVPDTEIKRLEAVQARIQKTRES